MHIYMCTYLCVMDLEFIQNYLVCTYTHVHTSARWILNSFKTTLYAHMYIPCMHIYMCAYLCVMDLVLVQDALEDLGRDVCRLAGQLHVQLDAAIVVAFEIHIRFSLI